MATPAADEIERQLAQLKADLERQIARTQKLLEERLKSGLLDADLEAARRVGDELADLLRKNFNVIIDGYERASMAVGEKTLETLAAAGIPEAFTTQSIASLRAQVDGTLADITTIADEAASELRTLIVDTVRSQVPPGEALQALTDKLNGSASKAATMADTGIAAFDREVTISTSEAAGVEWFLYDGPLDQLTRPYCDARVGKRFTLASLDAVDNDTGPNPPSRYCGGWNCRHRLTPLLDPDEIASYPEG